MSTLFSHKTRAILTSFRQGTSIVYKDKSTFYNSYYKNVKIRKKPEKLKNNKITVSTNELYTRTTN